MTVLIVTFAILMFSDAKDTDAGLMVDLPPGNGNEEILLVELLKIQNVLRYNFIQ